MVAAKKKRLSRAGLSPDGVLKAALKVVDAEGAQSLTMRRLGKALGVEAMSLYNHVRDKRALLAGVLDLAASEIELPEPDGGDWREWVRSWMRGGWALFRTHPNLFRLLLADVPPGPRLMGKIDALFARLQAAGFSPEEQLRAWEVLKAFLYGSVVQAPLSATDASPAELRECCTNIARVLPAYGCCDRDRLFEEGLDVILAGIADPSAPQGSAS